MSWSWNDVYPGKRMVQLILDEDQIALLSQMRGLSLVAPNTFKLADDAVIAVRGGGKEPPQKDMRKRVPADDATASKVVEAPVVKAPSKPLRKTVKPASKPAPIIRDKPKKPPTSCKTQQAMTHLVAGAEKQLHRTISDDVPTRRGETKRPPSSVSKEDIALVAKAIASGEITVTVCPPMTFTPEEEIGAKYLHPTVRKRREVARKRKAQLAAQQEAEGG